MVNIQGDEPLLEPEIIDQVVAALQAAPDAVYRLLSKTFFHGSQHLQVPVLWPQTPMEHLHVASEKARRCMPLHAAAYRRRLNVTHAPALSLSVNKVSCAGCIRCRSGEWSRLGGFHVLHGLFNHRHHRLIRLPVCA